MTVAVLGAGPHGRQIAHDIKGLLYDDNKLAHGTTRVGADRHPWVIGAVWPEVRHQIAARVAGAHFAPHEGGRIIFPTAYVGIEVEIGRHTHVLPHATVSHGCQLGEFVTIATGATLCGEVTVDDDVFIGAGAILIHGGLKIGRGAKIGAGVVIKRDVEPGEVVR